MRSLEENSIDNHILYKCYIYNLSDIFKFANLFSYSSSWMAITTRHRVTLTAVQGIG